MNIHIYFLKSTNFHQLLVISSVCFLISLWVISNSALRIGKGKYNYKNKSSTRVLNVPLIHMLALIFLKVIASMKTIILKPA